MSFFDEILSETGLSLPASGYNIVDYNGEVLYAEGIKRVLSFDRTSVRLEARKAVITVDGEDLTVENLTRGARSLPAALRPFARKRNERYGD